MEQVFPLLVLAVAVENSMACVLLILLIVEKVSFRLWKEHLSGALYDCNCIPGQSKHLSCPSSSSMLMRAVLVHPTTDS